MADISKITIPSGASYDLKDSTGRKEAYLEWGGRNLAASYAPIDAAMIPELGANRLELIPAGGIQVEYSRDGGSTWTDYGASDTQKMQLFSSIGTNVFLIGKADSTNKANANYQLRVTITTDVAKVYTVLNKFVIYVTTNGSSGTWVSIDRAIKSTETTFVNVVNKASISGWSGYNIINVAGITTYGNNASAQNSKIRFTFGCTGGSTSYNGLIVGKIMGFGGVGWTTPNNLAKLGRPFTYDVNQNVTFPAQLTATKFNGTATNADKVNNLTVETAVPKNAKFTDTNTTYSAGTGLSLSGTQFSNSGATGVKGNAETSYRTGNVNITPLNLGLGNAKIFYGTSDTAAATVAKAVTCSDFKSADLVAGAIVFVKFTNTNSGAVASITLNVNSTGAKPIKQILNSSVSNLSAAEQIIANETYMFTYDGTNWVTKLNYNTTYSALTQADATAGTATTARLITAKVLNDTIDGKLSAITNAEIDAIVAS